MKKNDPEYAIDPEPKNWSKDTVLWLVKRGRDGNFDHPQYNREAMMEKVKLANRKLARMRWPWGVRP